MEKYMLFGGSDSSDDGPLDIPEYMKNDEPGDTQSSFSGEEKSEKETQGVRSRWSSVEEEEDYEEDDYGQERRTARRRRGPFRIAAYAITAIVVVAVVTW